MAFNDTLEYNYNKINKVRKYFRRTTNILELILINYENLNYYIRLDYNKHNNLYHLHSINLDLIDNNIKDYLNSEYLKEETALFLINLFSELNIQEYDKLDKKIDKDIVIFNANILDYDIHLKFNKYIPVELIGLANIFTIIFANLPKRLDPLFDELLSTLTGTSYKYEYKKEFSFDLYRGKLDNIFNNVIATRGEEYFKDKRVLFLEKIDNRFFAAVKGKEQDKYLVVIDYNHKERVMKVYCNCPCEFYCKHIYAVILAIRKKKFKNFYKVRYIKENEYAYERILNFNYFLSTGVSNDMIEIVDDYGEILLSPIYDKNNNPKFEIIEDDNKHTLAKQTDL